MFIMQWRGAPVESGGREKIDLAAQDSVKSAFNKFIFETKTVYYFAQIPSPFFQNGNTALHVAAASGLEHCVQALINAGSPLFTENNDKMTPCDMAVKHGHHAIAQLLESKMVFVS